MTRRTLILFGILALIGVPPLRAKDEAPAKKDDPEKRSAEVRDRTLVGQQIVSRRFADFKVRLLRLEQRLERGTRVDQSRARDLRGTLGWVDKRRLDAQLDRMVRLLSDRPLTNLADVQEAAGLSRRLAAEFRSLLTRLWEGEAKGPADAKGQKVPDRRAAQELLRQEEVQFFALKKVFQSLQEARLYLVSGVLPDLMDGLGEPERAVKAARAAEVQERLRRCARDVGEVRAAFGRLLEKAAKEQLPPAARQRVRRAAYEPLQRITNNARGELRQAEEAVRRLRSILDANRKGTRATGAVAREKLDLLIARLAEVLNGRDGIADIALRRAARDLEQRQDKQTAELDAHREYLQKALLRSLVDK